MTINFILAMEPETEELVLPEKKKKKPRSVAEVESRQEDDAEYLQLLERIYSKISENTNPNNTEKKAIEPPQISRIGVKKVAWTNFSTECKTINRSMEHVMRFVLEELCTTGSLAKDNIFIINGRFQSLQLEAILKRYIVEYVVCRVCKSRHTELIKENRILFVKCQDCLVKTPVKR